MSSPEVNKQATEDAKARVVDLILAVLHVQPGTAPGTGRTCTRASAPRRVLVVASPPRGLSQDRTD
jgi:hypothetical protein